MSAVSKILGIAERMLHNWIKADCEGRLSGPGTKPVSAEQMEIARLRAEFAHRREKTHREGLRRHINNDALLVHGSSQKMENKARQAITCHPRR